MKRYILIIFIIAIAGAVYYLALNSEPQIGDDQLTHIKSKTNLIVVDAPKPGEVITSPLTVRGKARGTWFFEGDFPLILTDWDGLIIAEHYATAKGEWMTEEFVQFEGTIEFNTPEFGETGTLIFQKDNASGLPQHDDALEILIRFK